MKVRLVSGSHFSSAHRLYRKDWDDEANRRVFDKCNNPNGHGHTYELEVTVEGEIDSETGYVMDFGDLKRAVQENVVSKLDRRNLNFDVGFLSGVNPTAENIARLIVHVTLERATIPAYAADVTSRYATSKSEDPSASSIPFASIVPVVPIEMPYVVPA